MNKDILRKVIHLEPEYLNKTNDININKKQLFNISKLICEEINNEINGINKYINDYTNNYKDKNIYNMHYYLYNINNLFLENETNFLLTELKNAFIDTIGMHKQIIDYNYELATSYLDKLKKKVGNIWVCTGLYKRIFVNFRTNFTNYTVLANSDKVYNNLENNYYKIKNEIFKFVKNKLSSINKYYFEKDIYKDNFYFINKINLKLSTIFEKINNFFSKERFSLFKAELFEYSFNEIQQYNEKKFTDLENYYNQIVPRTNGYYDTDADYMYRKHHFWSKVGLGKKKKKICIFISFRKLLKSKLGYNSYTRIY